MITTLTVIVTCPFSHGQALNFTYDASGNRTKREYSAEICNPFDPQAQKKANDSTDGRNFDETNLEVTGNSDNDETKSKTDTEDSKTGKTDHHAHSITITPNPTRGIIRAEGLNLSGQGSINVYNALGELIYWKELSAGEGTPIINGTTEIDLSMQPKGIYLLKIISGEDIFTERIAIQ